MEIKILYEKSHLKEDFKLSHYNKTGDYYQGRINIVQHLVHCFTPVL